ncbi:MAG: ATP-binding cassette domain-containing protein, partial [Chitinophagia bacterium]|nr:ATP-binding cassette domain-containing protein [Chitinophagia bacterium]
MSKVSVSPLRRIFEILETEKREITAIYIYAILYGLVQLSLPLGIQSIIGFVLGGSISISMVLLIIAVVLGVLLYGLLQVNQKKIIEKIQQQLFVRYSFRYTYTLPKLKLDALDGYYLPEAVNKLFESVSIQKGISKLLLDVPAASIQIIFGLSLLAFYHAAFILFGLLLLIILYLILKSTGMRGLETSMQESNYKYKTVAFIQDLARVLPIFKLTGNREYSIMRTDEYVSEYLNWRTAHFKILLIQYWVLIALKTLITAAMLIIGAYLLVEQQINIGQFISAEIVILTVIGSVEKLIGNLDNIYDVATSLEKINKLAEKETEPAFAAKGSQNNEVLTITNIATKNISYSYPANQKVMDVMNFSINAGEKVAIAGKEGSGKTTLIKLLATLITPTSGQVLINNKPTSSYPFPYLRSNIGLFLSKADVFEGTLLDNITLSSNFSE